MVNPNKDRVGLGWVKCDLKLGTNTTSFWSNKALKHDHTSFLVKTYVITFLPSLNW